MIKNLVKSFLIFVFSLVPVLANISAQDAQNYVKDLGNRAISSLTAQSVPDAERSSRFRLLLNEGFDVQAIGKFVMGQNWRRMSSDQRKVYLSTFEDRLVATYANRFKEYAGVKFIVKESRVEDDGRATVESTIEKSDMQPIPVTWKLYSTDRGVKIVDVLVDGISMSVTLRSDFAGEVQRLGNDINAFLKELQSRNLK